MGGMASYGCIHQRQKPGSFGMFGDNGVQHAGKSDRLGRQVGVVNPVAGRDGVARGVGQVDDLEDRVDAQFWVGDWWKSCADGADRGLSAPDAPTRITIPTDPWGHFMVLLGEIPVSVVHQLVVASPAFSTFLASGFSRGSRRGSTSRTRRRTAGSRQRRRSPPNGRRVTCPGSAASRATA